MLVVSGRDRHLKYLLSLERGMPALGVRREEISLYTSCLLDLGILNPVSEKPTPQSQEVSTICAPLHLEGFSRICGVACDVVVLLPHLELRAFKQVKFSRSGLSMLLLSTILLLGVAASITWRKI